MDNFSHTIMGVALAQAGLNRYAKATYPTWLMVLGANGPDIDVFAGVGADGARYLEVHRGPTHSFVGSPMVAAIAAAIVWLVHRHFRKDRPYPWISALFLAWVGVLGHLLMDYITPYGTRLFWPFSNARVAWDIFPIIDLWLLPVILVVILMPFFFQLISSEIGARKTSFRPAAITVLVLFCALGAVRGLSHQRMMATLDSFLYKGRMPKRFSAFPDSGSPFLWHCVIDTGETLEETDANVFEEFDATESRTFYPPEPSPAIDAARRTRVAHAFLDFARYPYTYMERLEDGGFEVVFRDLRYEVGTLRIRKGAVARIRLDQNLKIVSERFSFRDSGALR